MDVNFETYHDFVYQRRPLNADAQETHSLSSRFCFGILFGNKELYKIYQCTNLVSKLLYVDLCC